LAYAALIASVASRRPALALLQWMPSVGEGAGCAGTAEDGEEAAFEVVLAGAGAEPRSQAASGRRRRRGAMRVGVIWP
jgi:hypothetical protein